MTGLAECDRVLYKRCKTARGKRQTFVVCSHTKVKLYYFLRVTWKFLGISLLPFKVIYFRINLRDIWRNNGSSRKLEKTSTISIYNHDSTPTDRGLSFVLFKRYPYNTYCLFYWNNDLERAWDTTYTYDNKKTAENGKGRENTMRMCKLHMCQEVAYKNSGKHKKIYMYI